MEETICRLCFNFVKNEFEVIDAVVSQMLEVLLLKVDFDASENPVLCQDCGEVIRKLYLFKSTCVDTEKYILSFAAGKEIVELDIKEVYQVSNDVKVITSDDFNVCRFCMKQMGKSNFVSLDALANDGMSEWMPEMDLKIIKDPVVCTSCRESLECYIKFIRNCFDTEEKITKYRLNEGINKSQIKLSNVPHSFKAVWTHPDESAQMPVIKQEISFDVEHKPSYEMLSKQIKPEVQDIKIEDNLEQKNPPEVTVDQYEAYILEKTEKNNVINMCGICTYETKYKSNLKSHMLIHKNNSEVVMYKCGICAHKTKHKYTIKKHMLRQHAIEIEMYKCEICTYETKYKSNLKNHMLIHKDSSEVVMYKCGLCTHTTKHKYTIKKHMLRQHDLETEMYKCDMCTLKTKYKKSLEKHMLLHKDTSEIEMHKCGVCTFETRYKKGLKSHMNIHQDSSKVEMYKCEICHFETRYKKGIKNHMITHEESSNVEMYKCGMCTFATRHRSSLKIHMLTHKDSSEVEMYKCDMCDYETKYKHNSVKHKLIHKKCTDVKIIC